MNLQKLGKALQKRRDWGGILILDGGGAKGHGHLRQEKECKVEPADMRNKSPARVEGLCLEIERESSVQPTGQGSKRRWRLRGGGREECRADSVVQTTEASTGSWAEVCHDI